MTVIALTGWGQEDDKQRSREAGCDGHLVKPVDLDDLEKLLGDGRDRRPFEPMRRRSEAALEGDRLQPP
jgi:CheY-like chemotaxis protein